MMDSTLALNFLRFVQQSGYSGADDAESEKSDETYLSPLYNLDSFKITNKKLDFTQNEYDINCLYGYNGRPSKNKDCAICKNDDSKEECIMLKFCNHSFHQNCIDKWFEKNKTCPICRKKYNVDNTWTISNVKIDYLKKIPKFKHIRNLNISNVGIDEEDDEYFYNYNDKILQCDVCNNIIFEKYAFIELNNTCIPFCEYCVINKKNKCFEQIIKSTNVFDTSYAKNLFNREKFVIEIFDKPICHYFNNALPPNIRKLELNGYLSLTIFDAIGNLYKNNNILEYELDNIDINNDLFLNECDSAIFQNCRFNKDIIANNCKKIIIKNCYFKKADTIKKLVKNICDTYKMQDEQTIGIVQNNVFGYYNDAFKDLSDIDNKKLENILNNANTVMLSFKTLFFANLALKFNKTKVLALENIIFKTLPAFNFKHLTEIIITNIYDNEIELFDFSESINLESLEINKLKLKNIILPKNDNLITLKITKTNITTINYFSTKLTKIILTNNKITKIPLITNLNDLEELNLHCNRFEKIFVLDNCEKLESFNISNNKLMSLIMSKLPKLTYINASNNKIKHFGIILENDIDELLLNDNVISSFVCNGFGYIDESDDESVSDNNKIINSKGDDKSNFKSDDNGSDDKSNCKSDDNSSDDNTIEYEEINIKILNISNNKLKSLGNLTSENKLTIQALYCSNNYLTSIKDIYIQNKFIARNNRKLRIVDIKCDELMNMIDIRNTNVEKLLFNKTFVQVYNFKKCFGYSGRYIKLASDKFFRKFMIFNGDVEVFGGNITCKFY